MNVDQFSIHAFRLREYGYSTGCRDFPYLSLPQQNVPDCKVYGANMGPTWGRRDRGWPHVDPINLAIWGCRVLYLLLNTAPVNGTMITYLTDVILW